MSAEPCLHAERVDGVCRLCGDCAHEIVLNGACFTCGQEPVEVTVAPVAPRADGIVPLSRLRRIKGR